MLMAPDVLSSRIEPLEVVNDIYEFERRRDEVEESFYECDENWSISAPACMSSTMGKQDDRNDLQSQIAELSPIVDKLYLKYEDGDIPVGYRFKPTDGQLLVYLNRKAESEALPNTEIEDIDAHTFFTKHPKELVTDICDRREWYFYVQHDDEELYNNVKKEMIYDKLPCFWSMEERYNIHDEDIIDNVIGYKTVFRFFRKTKKTFWKLEEFRSNYEFDKTSTNWTLARIIRGTEY
ncbi:uncharacterized protein LOC141627994 [Silene latifolia]|uniref:uncharacterized protein LOC141627994 n=1 Tax=Silene latifolia TaxID=37657 RepID=UPI003D786B8E